MPSRIVTVVPAHDEAQLLPRCLAALARAAAVVRVPITTVVVLDACSDGSASTLPDGVESVVIDRRNPGAARAAGFRSFGSAAGHDTWFCTTDADSAVDPTWYRCHLRHAESADAAVGTVRVDDWADHPAAVQERFAAEYRAGDGNAVGRHVHGASLGVRASAYWSVGGFRALPVGEDQDLVDRLAATGFTIAWADDLCVDTSDRIAARVVNGFGGHLRALADPTEGPRVA